MKKLLLAILMTVCSFLMLPPAHAAEEEKDDKALKEVQEALGHQTITMTMRYSHLAPDHLRAAVAALDGVLSSPESEPTKVSAQGSAQELVAVSGVAAN